MSPNLKKKKKLSWWGWELFAGKLYPGLFILRLFQART